MDPSFHKSSKAPIFICGEGRSGTKLLRDCLAKHSLLHTFRCESYFFVDSTFQKMRFIDEIKDTDLLIKAVLAALLSKNKPSAERVIKNRNFEPEYDEYLVDIKKLITDDMDINKFTLLDLCANYLTQKASKSRWIEKTPYHIYYIERIKQFYPDAKFIINYRDPRAVVASWLKKDSNKTLLGVTQTWNRVANEIQYIKERNLANVYFMKYEALISDPEKILREICEFLEIEYDPCLMDVSVVNSFYQEQGTAGFSKDAVNRWKKILNPNQIALVELLSEKNRLSLDYPDSGEKPCYNKLFPSLLKEILVLPIKKLTKLFKWVKVN